MPDEQIIEIEANGNIILNNRVFGADGSKDLPELVTLLAKYKLASEANKTKALVTIQAADDALHERVIDVMNACAGAKIKNITFGMGE